MNPDGKIDAWFASPGGDGSDGKHQWDWIRHKSSADGGHTWSAEEVALKPTAGSRDRQSVCDPGVIKIGDWYYLGVTAVEDPKGNCNEVFIARSKSAAGPFEKWDGKGWTGSATPIFSFRAPADAWGLGEPSFVRVDQTLFIYYSESSHDDHGHKINRTRVATAPANVQEWPSHLTDRGTAFDRPDGEDSADVKFDQTSNRFIAVTTAERFSPKAHINVRWSDDGLTFGKPIKVDGPTMTRCHNVGISGTPDGHLLADDKNFIAYAYADGSRPGVSWAFWHTYLNPIKIAR